MGQSTGQGHAVGEAKDLIDRDRVIERDPARWRILRAAEHWSRKPNSNKLFVTLDSSAEAPDVG